MAVAPRLLVVAPDASRNSAIPGNDGRAFACASRMGKLVGPAESSRTRQDGARRAKYGRVSWRVAPLSEEQKERKRGGFGRTLLRRAGRRTVVTLPALTWVSHVLRGFLNPCSGKRPLFGSGRVAAFPRASRCPCGAHGAGDETQRRTRGPARVIREGGTMPSDRCRQCWPSLPAAPRRPLHGGCSAQKAEHHASRRGGVPGIARRTKGATKDSSMVRPQSHEVPAGTLRKRIAR